MKPYYELKEADIARILALIRAADEVGLGNVCFQIGTLTTTVFDMDLFRDGWRVIVAVTSRGKKNSRDEYKIKNGILTYQYSETD